MIKRGELRINGQPASTGDWIESGQILERVDPQQSTPTTYRHALEVVFEDDYLAIINKPPGMEVSGNKFKTIENALAGNLAASSQLDSLAWSRPVHRLDYSTSGLLLVAKTASIQVALGRQFEEQKIQKRYCAVVSGLVENAGQVDTPIKGQSALSHYSAIESVHSLRSGALSLVHLFPATGRTHQLRIHMAGIGHPIVGDQKYGTKGHVLKGKGLFLSATQLRFLHPATEQKITISLKTPPKFAALLQREQRRWEKYNGAS